MIPYRANNPNLAPHYSRLTRKQVGKTQRFKVATWNVQGKLKYMEYCDTLLSDLKTKQVDIAALQETKAQDIIHNCHGYTILGFPHNNIHYGLAFAIREDIQIKDTEIISDRIAVMRIYLNDAYHTSNNSINHRDSYLVLINVYAPHSTITQNTPELTEAFYDTLQHTYDRYKTKGAIILILGDLNARVGSKRSNLETHLGAHTKRYSARNTNGHSLSEFSLNNQLYLTNTTFKHRSCHKSTYTGQANNKIIHNQIDYIICPLYLKPLLVDSRTYNGTIFSSDHKLLITLLQLNKFYVANRDRSKKKKSITPQLDYRLLATDPEIRNNFNTTLGHYLSMLPAPPGLTPNGKWNALHEAIVKAAQQTIPAKQKTDLHKPPSFTHDNIFNLS